MPIIPQILVFLVHGGNAAFREDDQVQVREITKNQYSTIKGKPVWSENLDKALDSTNFESINPLFPNAADANYQEWARFFEQVLVTKPTSEIILIGHSLGTVFLQKYLAENNLESKFGMKIKQIHLVGCCPDHGNFRISPSWSKILSQIPPNEIHLYHSKDDLICAFSEAKMYAAKLPRCNFHKFQDRGHFEQPTLPELVEVINSEG